MNKTLPSTLLMLSLFAVFSACSGFETLEVVYSSPANHACGVADDAAVEIAFSGDVERDGVEKSFVLADSSSRVEGDFEWLRKRLSSGRGAPQTRRGTDRDPRSGGDTKGIGWSTISFRIFTCRGDLSYRGAASDRAFVVGGSRTSRSMIHHRSFFPMPMDVRMTNRPQISRPTAGRFVATRALRPGGKTRWCIRLRSPWMRDLLIPVQDIFLSVEASGTRCGRVAGSFNRRRRRASVGHRHQRRWHGPVLEHRRHQRGYRQNRILPRGLLRADGPAERRIRVFPFPVARGALLVER